MGLFTKAILGKVGNTLEDMSKIATGEQTATNTENKDGGVKDFIGLKKSADTATNTAKGVGQALGGALGSIMGK